MTILAEAKGDNSLTKADKAAHLAIVDYLNKTDIPVLSEEGRHDAYETRSGWETLWIVDPLDGTKEFIKRNGEFTVNIALVKNGKPAAGVIYVPVKKTLYFAISEEGSQKAAFKCEGVEVGDSEKLWRISRTKRCLTGFYRKTFYHCGFSFSHVSGTEEYIQSLEAKHGNVEVMSVGSSLKICMVAEGSADEYPRFVPIMEWDTAAGQAIAEGVSNRMLKASQRIP